VHNIWVEGDRMYLGYYQAGLRVVDISGELRGDLYAQGREVARILTTDQDTTVPNWSMTWGAQIHKGRIYSSDLNSGIWITPSRVRPHRRVGAEMGRVHTLSRAMDSLESEVDMAVAKVIEVMGEGSSIEKAVEAAVAGAGESVRNIQNVWVQDIKAMVDDGKVDRYRVATKITFVVD
jgi:flavin-binding protein dodecin